MDLAEKKLRMIAQHLAEQEAFMKKYSIPCGAIVMFAPNGTVFVFDQNNGVGVKGKAKLISSAWNDGEVGNWRWGWKVTNFDSPIIEKKTIAEFMENEFPGMKAAVNTGEAKTTYMSETWLRAMSHYAGKFDYITDFSGPTAMEFVIGVYDVSPHIMEKEICNQLAGIADMVERKVTDPMELLAHNMLMMKLGVKK